ncbi:MAG: hypothetical protein P0107_04650 [Nitrosomonas sp.]|nr:hypothetical protein [Nitrosomonas sp.]
MIREILFVFRALQARLVVRTATGGGLINRRHHRKMMGMARGLMSALASTGAIPAVRPPAVNRYDRVGIAAWHGCSTLVITWLGVSIAISGDGAAALLSTSQYIADATSTSSSENLSFADADHSPALHSYQRMASFSNRNLKPILLLSDTSIVLGERWPAALTSFCCVYVKHQHPTQNLPVVSKAGYVRYFRFCADGAICRIRTPMKG